MLAALLRGLASGSFKEVDRAAGQAALRSKVAIHGERPVMGLANDQIYITLREFGVQEMSDHLCSSSSPIKLARCVGSRASGSLG